MLKNKKTLLITLCLFFSFPLCSFSVTGSESYAKEMKNLSSFKRIYISAGASEVYLTQGRKSEVRIEGEEDLVNQLDVKVVQGELEILYKNKRKRSSKTGIVKIYITTNTLTNITARGQINISSVKSWKLSSLNLLLTGAGAVELNLNVKALSVQLSGSCELTLTGSAQVQNIAVTGSGLYDGEELKSTKATVILSGAGSAIVAVKDSLIVSIYGSGDVSYKGSPTIQSNIYGSGRILKKGIL